VYYVTRFGNIPGTLRVCPYFITFDPKSEEDIYVLVDIDKGDSIEYQCFIDVIDIHDCTMFGLPNPDQNKSSCNDYYLQLGLKRIKGKAFSVVEEPGVVQFKVYFYT